MNIARIRALLIALTFAMLIYTIPACAQMLPAAALKGKHLLFIIGEPENGQPSDDALAGRHFEQMGFVVSTVADRDARTPPAGTDLIVISSTADARLLQGKYAASSVPVFTWNTYLYPEMKMTGPHLHTDYEVVDPQHFFARSYSELYGYGAGNTSEIAEAADLKPKLFGTLYLEPQTAGWGRPAEGATTVVTLEGDPGKAGVFAYERGSMMYDNFAAPARRVGFYLSNANFHLLTAVYGPAARDPQLYDWYAGLRLFDAAIRWAASPPPAMPQPRQPGSFNAHGKKLLYVERKFAFEGEETDEHIVEHLRQMGFEVTIVDQMDPEMRAEGEDAIVISATCSKYKLSNKYVETRLPVLLLEGLYSDTMHLTGRDRYVDYGEHGEPNESDDPPEAYLKIVGAWHPMAAGLPPGLVKVLNEPGMMKWAVPAPSAIAIASLPGEAEQKAIFDYERGSAMYGGFIAPDRRELFPLDNDAFDDLTPQGVALFDAAVEWLVTPQEMASPEH
ncbi:MAG TPA: hypothetical protein VGS10_15750 [Terracidiphilus sp.]|nr:hypothetical protein [Terracidiphilus sp.]